MALVTAAILDFEENVFPPQVYAPKVFYEFRIKRIWFLNTPFWGTNY